MYIKNLLLLWKQLVLKTFLQSQNLVSYGCKIRVLRIVFCFLIILVTFAFIRVWQCVQFSYFLSLFQIHLIYLCLLKIGLSPICLVIKVPTNAVECRSTTFRFAFHIFSYLIAAFLHLKFPTLTTAHIGNLTWYQNWHLTVELKSRVIFICYLVTIENLLWLVVWQMWSMYYCPELEWLATLHCYHC